MQRSKKRKLRKLHGSAMLRRGVPMASGLLVAFSGAQAQDTSTPAIGEIVVTAQKREERLQDVPIAIQAFGTEKLEQLRVADFDDYVKYLPNVSYQQDTPGFAVVFMRGVTAGDVGNHSGPLPSVGMYLDEQPITTIQGPLDIHIYDIARVETLAGPQGTLYGASSQSGTIRIITNKPQLNEFEASYDVEGNTITDGDVGYQAEGMVNVPLGERTALRLVGWYRHDAGFIDNVFGTRTYPSLEAASPGNGTVDNASAVEDDYNEVDTIGARAQLRIDLNDNWTVTPSLMAQSAETEGLFAYDPGIGDLAIRHFYPEGAEDDWYQAALTVEGRLSDWTVTYSGAYLDRDDETQSDYHDYAIAYDNGSPDWGEYFFDDADAIVNPAEYILGQDSYKMLSQELRLASPAEWRTRFVTGLFYQKQQHDIEQRYQVDDIATSIEVTGYSDTWWLTQQEREDQETAVFGEVTFDFTDKLSGTAGLRLFENENSIKGFFGFGFTNDFTGSTGEKSCFGFGPSPTNPPSPGGGTNGAPCDNLNEEVDDKDHTEKLNLTYKIDDDRMVYATWATGYRPGGINRRGGFPPYEADFLDSYELGWKTTWMDGTLRWNGAVFQQLWDDFQFSYLGLNGLTNITNAGDAEIPGIETDIEWAATDALTLSAGAMWIKPELKEDFCESLDEDGNPLPGGTCDPTEFAPSGTQLPITPEFKANVVARYAYSFGEFDGNAQGAVVHTGAARSALVPGDEVALGGKMDDYTLVDLSASLGRDNWSAELFVDNAFDERSELARFAQCDELICAAGAGLGGSTYVVTSQPRTIGLRFGQKFGGGR